MHQVGNYYIDMQLSAVLLWYFHYCLLYYYCEDTQSVSITNWSTYLIQQCIMLTYIFTSIKILQWYWSNVVHVSSVNSFSTTHCSVKLQILPQSGNPFPAMPLCSVAGWPHPRNRVLSEKVRFSQLLKSMYIPAFYGT